MQSNLRTRPNPAPIIERMPPFQQTYSDEFKAAIVTRALRDRTSGAELVRMAERGDIGPDFPKCSPHVATVLDWIKQAKRDADQLAVLESSGLPLRELAAKSFGMAKREIELMEIAQKQKGKSRVELDPSRLDKLLATAERAAKLLGNGNSGNGDSAPAPDEPSNDAGDEDNALTEAEQAAIAAFGQSEETAAAAG